MEISKGLLRDICIQHKLYSTPHLNDKLYLNFRGFTRIAALEEYSSLKALFLEGNALQSLEGLPRLEDLKCLYVQQNCLRCLDGLEQLPNLNTLNISTNSLTSLQQLECCPRLGTLIADRNHLSAPAALQALLQCSELHTLDLQHNNIEDTCVLEGVIARLPQLRCLYLQGNPVVSAIPSYRKTVIAACPALTYLDDRPVMPEERLWCEAWACGGIEAERAERVRQKEEAAAKERRNFEWLQQLRREGFRKRRAMLGLPDGDTDPYFDTLPEQQQTRPARSGGGSGSTTAHASDDSEDVENDGFGRGEEEQSEDEACLQEPPELVAARQRLAAFKAGRDAEECAAGQPEATPATPSASAHASAGSLDDGIAYLAAVEEAQQQLDAAGAPAGPAASAALAGAPADSWLGSEARAKLASLKAANAAALASIGVAALPVAACTAASSDLNAIAGCSCIVADPALATMLASDGVHPTGTPQQQQQHGQQPDGAVPAGAGGAALGLMDSWSSAVTDPGLEAGAEGRVTGSTRQGPAGGMHKAGPGSATTAAAAVSDDEPCCVGAEHVLVEVVGNAGVEATAGGSLYDLD